jgi:hypothetical protein
MSWSWLQWLAVVVLLLAVAWRLGRGARTPDAACCAPQRAARRPNEPGALPVDVADAGRMNLLGLLLASLLRRRLAEAGGVHARRLRGDVVFEASGMQAVVRFEPQRVRVERVASGRPIARIEGSLAGLLDAALGRRRLANVARGQLRARGRPLALWRVLRLLSPPAGHA